MAQGSYIERVAETLSHPLIAKSVVKTVPIKEVYAQIKFMIVCGSDSRCFSARTEAGKSQALKIILRWLQEEFPKVLFIYLLVTNTSSAGSNENLINLAGELPGCRQAGTAYQLRSAIKNALLHRVLAERRVKVVLLLDEGQCLTLHELEFLKDLYNSLDKEGVHLATVVFAQEPQLGDRLTKLIEEQGRRDLVRRIFGSPRLFRDLIAPSEVKDVFSAIDDASMPGQPEIRWSQFFVPMAWSDRGWRLKNETGMFMKAASEMKVLKRIFVRDSDAEDAGNGAGGMSKRERVKTVSAGILFIASRIYLVNAASFDESGEYPWPESLWKNAIRDALSEAGGADVSDGARYTVHI